jgi:phosphoserine aminotransferase
MLSFYPGPSKVYPQVAQYLQDAYNEGILSINHRSPACMQIMQETLRLLHEKLDIPADYSIYFVSSATEVWEIIAQSLTQQSGHYYNGAFGEKWFQYVAKLVPKTTGISFEVEEHITETIDFSQENAVLCLTQNETSNGTQISDYRGFKQENNIVAIDATSSLGGIDLDWTQGDIWFASVQKCLGLPAGMALMICSPKTLQKAQEINDRKYYNSLLFIHENFEKSQTHYTPNVLAIYLLMRVLQEIEPISIISEKIKKQAKDWYDFLEKTEFKPLIQDKKLRSDTVIVAKGTPEAIKTIKEKAESAGIILGNGYGEWKNDTFRIANFPAIEAWEIEQLKGGLS